MTDTASLPGMNTAMSYPYEAQQGRCRWNQSNVVVRIQGFQTLPSNESGEAGSGSGAGVHWGGGESDPARVAFTRVGVQVCFLDT